MSEHDPRPPSSAGRGECLEPPASAPGGPLSAVGRQLSALNPHRSAPALRPLSALNHEASTGLADASLVLVTLIWGTTFVVVKVAVETTDPVVFVALRFGIGALVLALLYGRRVATARGATLRAGGLLGLVLLAGFLLQTQGLRLTSPARAAFITGLSVVLVPAIEALLLRARLDRGAVVGVLLSTVGLVVLSAPLTPEELRGGDWTGDLLVLGCALAFAVHIVGVGRVAARHDPVALATVQVAVTALLAGTAAVALGAPLPGAGLVWLDLAYMGAIGTALVFRIQSWAQVHTSATHTALIFALEPVFAAVFAVLLYGETLTARTAVGGALMLAGMLAAELRFWPGDLQRDPAAAPRDARRRERPTAE